ncbi:MAG: hypothetical protein K1X60_18050, partial [Nitrospira sp.]|nr:hypothetical protein [Nitrospira sp.]
MTPLLSMFRSGAVFAVAVHCLAPAIPVQAASDHSRVDITGDYRYAYHQPETASEAKQHACREALHQAISTSTAVREHTASIVDSKLFHTLVHTLAAQHVTDQQILQQSEQGRTVYCKI